jgi:hypothetical protein
MGPTHQDLPLPRSVSNRSRGRRHGFFTILHLIQCLSDLFPGSLPRSMHHSTNPPLIFSLPVRIVRRVANNFTAGRADLTNAARNLAAHLGSLNRMHSDRWGRVGTDPGYKTGPAVPLKPSRPTVDCSLRAERKQECTAAVVRCHRHHLVSVEGSRCATGVCVDRGWAIPRSLGPSVSGELLIGAPNRRGAAFHCDRHSLLQHRR